MRLKSDLKMMYVQPLYFYPIFVFLIFIMPTLFDDNGDSWLKSDLASVFYLFIAITLSMLAIHFIFLVPAGKCDITIDRKGITSNRIKYDEFLGFIGWENIDSVYIFTLGKGPKYIYIYIKPSKKDKYDSIRRTRIPFDFVSQSTREVERCFERHTKLRRKFFEH